MHSFCILSDDQEIRWNYGILCSVKDHNPNGHIFANYPSIRRRNSTWKVSGNYIESTWKLWHRFKVDILTWVSTLLYSLLLCYHFLTSSTLGTYSKLFWYSAESMYFNDIDVITDTETTEIISFGYFATTQINGNKDNFCLLQNNTHIDHNTNIYN